MRIGLTMIAALFLWVTPQRMTDSEHQMCLCEFVAPTYPPTARLSRTQGVIRVKASFNAKGTPAEIEVLEEKTMQPPLSEILRRAAVTAIKQWRFCPSAQGFDHNEIVVTFRFTLLLDPTPRESDQWFPTKVSFQPPATVEIETTSATINTN